MHTFHDFMVNAAPGGADAITKLDALVKRHDANAKITKRPGSPVLPASAVFPKTTTNLKFGWTEVCAVLGISDGYKVPQRPVSPETIKDVPTKKLVATQPNLFADMVARKIDSPLDLWSVHETPLFVLNKGSYYIFDGHHRVAAALLLKLPTVRGQVVHL